MILKTMVKAGKLANGFELGKGRKVHLVPENNSYYGQALCGERPAIQWAERALAVDCEKCLKLQHNYPSGSQNETGPVGLKK